MIDLKDFTKDVLTQISQAVIESRINLKESDVSVSDGYFDGNARSTLVKFDVAVSVTESKNTEGKAGIFVLESTGIGGKNHQAQTIVLYQG